MTFNSTVQINKFIADIFNWIPVFDKRFSCIIIKNSGSIHFPFGYDTKPAYHEQKVHAESYRNKSYL